MSSILSVPQVGVADQQIDGATANQSLLQDPTEYVDVVDGREYRYVIRNGVRYQTFGTPYQYDGDTVHLFDPEYVHVSLPNQVWRE